MLRLCGWSLVGEFPDVPRAVLIAAPHSSWWDGVWGLLMKVGIGADVQFMGKQELFRGPLGSLLRRLGGMPIDRGAAKGMVEQMVDQFRQREASGWASPPKARASRWHAGRAASGASPTSAGVPIVTGLLQLSGQDHR